MNGTFIIHTIGLIPAWAGKTSATAWFSVRGPAHPRAGGENPEDGIRSFGVSGSSPRGRGKLTFDAVCLARIRLIPARAGKTVW